MSARLEVQNTSEKGEKIRAKSRKLDEDAMLCIVIPGGQTDAGSSQKHFLPFRVLLNVGIDPNFPQKLFFFFTLFREKFRLPAKIILP